MRKLSVLLGTFFLFMMSGCSADPNDFYIEKTLETLNGTTSTIEAVTKDLTDAVAKAKNDKTPLAVGPIDQATEKAGDLKPKARTLQELKAHTDGLKDTLTPEQRAVYADKYKQKLQSYLEALDSAQKKLDVALREADEAASDDIGKSALEKLREKLKEVQTEFEVLTKRQS